MAENEFETCLNNGYKFYDEDNYDKAIDELCKALKIDPNHEKAKNYLASSYFNRGIRYFQNGEQDKAIADLSESIKLNPNDATAYGAHGTLLGKKNDHDGVIRDFTEVIRIEPTALAYSSRGDGYYKKSREYFGNDKENYFKYFELAIKDWEEAVKLDPEEELFQKQLETGISELEDRRSVSDFMSEAFGR